MGNSSNSTPAVPEPQNGVTLPSPAQRFVEQLALEASMAESVNGREISAQIIGNMLSADSLDAAIAVQDQGLPSGKDFANVELEVLNFEVRESDPRFEESSLGYYMAVQAVRLDTGEHVTFGVGAPNVMTILWIARAHDQLPFRCVIRSKAVSRGDLLTLYRLSERAVKAS